MRLGKYDIPWEAFLILLLAVGSQASMKMLAAYLGDTPISILWLEKAVLTPWAIIILICEIFVFVFWLRILSVINVSRAVPLTGLIYIFILLTGWIFFDEPVLKLEIIGSALILGGIWLLGATP